MQNAPDLRRLEQLAAASTGKLDIVLDPTLPASETPATATHDVRSGHSVPLSLQQRYQCVEHIGAGGMGVVYRAHDPRLGRDVALKLLKESDAVARSRFLIEARAQARVEHDNICRVYEVGETDNEPFIVMQLIDGKPLSEVKHDMTLRERLELMRTVAFAVHAAHERGLVHRDLKPGNILVEKRALGSFRPYVVDFGLARHFAQDAVHTPYASLGTPAYMAPEAASKQQGHSIDQRIDVYSLGATLYDVIAGRPPYVDDSPWNIVKRLEHENPPTIGDVAKGIPADLQAIVMKCLERDPNRRYSSAKALGDDLQRYLDDEPLEARRAGRTYVLRKKLRKHARAIMLGIGLVALSATGIGIRIREQRSGKVPPELAQEIGRSVAEMELYMRTAHQMPAHDIERERAVVRGRIKELEKRVPEGKAANDAMVLYALGRAHLALGDSVLACEYLERAKFGGYVSPELNYALSRAQLQTHRLLTTRARSYGTDPKRIEAEIAELDAKYLKPALERLHAAEPATIEAPLYALALMAKAENRFEDAAEKAHQAFEQAPLLYEAKVIEGEALGEIATRHWHSGKADWWKSMSAGMKVALDALGAAENIARSDPSVLQAICGARTRIMYAAYSTRKVAILPYYEAAREVCNRLVVVDPSSPESHTSRATMHAHYAYALARLDEPETDPLPIAEEAIRMGEEAKRLSHGALPAYQALGNALLARARALVDRGRRATDALKAAEQHFEEGRSIFRYEESLRSGLMTVHLLSIVDERRRGIDITPFVTRANLVIDEAIAAQPNAFGGYLKRTLVLSELIRQQVSQGELSKQSVDAAFDAVTTAKKKNPAFTFYYNNAELHGMMAQHALDTGTSPREALDEMAKDLAMLYEEEGDSIMWREFSGIEATLRAEWQLQRGEDPRKSLDAARRALGNATLRAPALIELAVESARVELIAAKYALSKKSATAETFEKVRAPLQSFLTDQLTFPDAHVVAAASHALAAEWRTSRRQSPEDEIVAGLAMVDRALAVNPKHPLAMDTQRRLQQLRGGTTK